MDSLTNWFQKTVIQTIWYSKQHSWSLMHEYYWSHHAYVTRKASQRSKAKFFNRPTTTTRVRNEVVGCCLVGQRLEGLRTCGVPTTGRIKTTFFSAPVYFLYSCIAYAEEKTSNSKVGYLRQMTRYTYGYIVYLCSWSDWFKEEKTTKRVGHSRVYCDHTRWHVVHIFPRRASNAARKPMGSNNHTPLWFYISSLFFILLIFLLPQTLSSRFRQCLIPYLRYF